VKDMADDQQQDNQAALDLEYVQLNVAKVRLRPHCIIGRTEAGDDSYGRLRRHD
jgi:hypothetical protein